MSFSANSLKKLVIKRERGRKDGGSRNEEGRGLMSCECTTKSEKHKLGLYLKNSNENLLQGVKHVVILKFKESVLKKLESKKNVRTAY